MSGDGLMPIVERVQLLHPQPGELLVLKCSRPMTPDDARNVRDWAVSAFPDLKVIVLDASVSLEVRPAE